MFNIFKLGSKKQKALYLKGIVNITDIPDNYDMTPRQVQRVFNYKKYRLYRQEKYKGIP